MIHISTQPIYEDVFFPLSLLSSHLSSLRWTYAKRYRCNLSSDATLVSLSSFFSSSADKSTDTLFHSLFFFPSLSPFQSAYRKFHSTETALLRVQMIFFSAWVAKKYLHWFCSTYLLRLIPSIVIFFLIDKILFLDFLVMHCLCFSHTYRIEPSL